MDQNNHSPEPSSEHGLRYCTFCGAVNDSRGRYCKECGKDLYPKDTQLKDYIKKEAKDQIKDKVSETIFNKLKQFLLAHLYGILLTASVVFTAVSAVTALGASAVPKDAVRLEEAPAANILGYLISDGEEGSEEEQTVSETASADGSAQDAEITAEPEISQEPASAEEPEAAPEPETTPDLNDLFSLPQNQEIYEAYLQLLPQAKGDVPGYYIYDIDKDGTPELLLTAEDGPNRGIEVYSYDDSSAYSAGILWGFSNGNPLPASYPDGNGIVLTEIARGYECIWVISKEGHSMTGDVRTSGNSVYEEPLYTDVSTYYQNAENDLFVSAGHPFRAETLSPFFEGSQLLGFNSASDDTALKEALGL